MRLGVSAQQRIHVKYQVLFSLKKNEKVFRNVVCSVEIGALSVVLMDQSNFKMDTLFFSRIPNLDNNR